MGLKILSLIGLLVFISICFLLSNNRKAIQWKPVIGGIGLQLLFALLILKTPFGRAIFENTKRFFDQILAYSAEGGKFVFGPLADIGLSSAVFGMGKGFIFVVQVAAVIIFVSSLMAVLYHWGIMQKVVYAFAIVMQKVMGTSGSESLSAAANIFVGQTEAPLVIKPYLDKMTSSEIMALMTGGMATVAGSVLAAYAGFGISAGHLLAASVMSAPATLAIAKIMVPETQKSETTGKVEVKMERNDSNTVDAACRGASEGMTLSINVMAMLIAFIALVALVNGTLTWLSSFFLDQPLTLELILGYLFAPFAFLMGVPSQDILQVGSLLGTKTVLNEFIAFIQLGDAKEGMDPRSVSIATYALCGFANFSSVAIQIGGIASLAPKRRKDLAKLGFKAMIGGTIASFMTACIAGFLI